MSEYHYQFNGDPKSVRIGRSGSGYSVTIGEHTYQVEAQQITPGRLSFSIDGKYHRAYVADDEAHHYIAFDATVYTLIKSGSEPIRRKATHAADSNLTAVMPGQIVKVLVNEGESVKRGQPLILLEAMKMEIRITTPYDGKVIKLLCSVGQVVERGQQLIELAAE